MPNRAERRASGKDYPQDLDEWAHDAIVTIQLDAVGDGPGRLFDYELPDFAQFATRGLFPNPLLRKMALKVDAGLTPSKLEEEEQGTYFDLMCWAIAYGSRKPDLVEMCGGIDAAAEWVATKMPPPHRIAIWQRAVHIFDVEDVLQFFENAAQMSKEAQGSDVKSITDLETFRAGSGGAEVPAGVGTQGEGTE